MSCAVIGGFTAAACIASQTSAMVLLDGVHGAFPALANGKKGLQAP